MPQNHGFCCVTIAFLQEKRFFVKSEASAERTFVGKRCSKCAGRLPRARKSHPPKIIRICKTFVLLLYFCLIFAKVHFLDKKNIALAKIYWNSLHQTRIGVFREKKSSPFLGRNAHASETCILTEGVLQNAKWR